MTKLLIQPSIQSSPSILSSNHDMVSIPGSSYSQTTSLSLEDSLEDSIDFISDPEDQPPSTHGIQSPIAEEQIANQNQSAELLTALTRHLVMPRLPILPNSPSNLSTPSNHILPTHQLQSSSRQNLINSSKINLQNKSSTSSCSKNLSFHSPQHPHQSSSTPRFLVVGDTQSAHGLGSLDAHLPSLSSFPNQLVRASEIVSHFKLSDPSTYDTLIEHIERPFIRLKEILNPKFFYHHHHSRLPAPTRDDLINVVNSWIEKEGYLLLLIEVKSFPLSAEELECILTLSRLIPTIPFIPSQIPPKKATDGQAIITRQLISKRIRHFSIPKPNHYQPFMFPNREECLVRSSKCYLDWLTVEFATSNLSINHYPREQDLRTNRGSESESDCFEPDRWSEKVSIQMERRNPKRQPDSDRRRQYQNYLSVPDGKMMEPLMNTQSNNENDEDEMTKRRQLQTWISIDSFGLPSLTGLMKLGLGQIRNEVGKILQQFYRYFLLDSDDNVPDCKLEKSKYPRNQLQELGQQPSFDAAQSDDDVSSPCHSSLPNPQNPPRSSPPPGNTTMWFIIGFVTATAAATISLRYKNEFFFV